MSRASIRKRAIIGIAAIACVLFASSLPPAKGEEPQKNPFDGDAGAVEQGSVIFDDYCSECHGTGTGGAGPDLTDGQWTYGGSDGEVFASVSGGRDGMPEFGNELKDEEIWKVIAFLRSIRSY